jgi:hypothetical protein
MISEGMAVGQRPIPTGKKPHKMRSLLFFPRQDRTPIVRAVVITALPALIIELDLFTAWEHQMFHAYGQYWRLVEADFRSTTPSLHAQPMSIKSAPTTASSMFDHPFESTAGHPGHQFPS